MKVYIYYNYKLSKNSIVRLEPTQNKKGQDKALIRFEFSNIKEAREKPFI